MPLWTASEHMPLRQKTASVTTKREILAGEHSDSTWAHLKVALQPMIPKALRKLGRSWTRPRKELLLTPTERSGLSMASFMCFPVKPSPRQYCRSRCSMPRKSTTSKEKCLTLACLAVVPWVWEGPHGAPDDETFRTARVYENTVHIVF